MRQIGINLLLALGLALPTSFGVADTLVVESVESSAGMARPVRGITMDQVQQQFGEPAARSGPVGEPPISQWSYPDFEVYFEHQYVIHAVVPHRK